MQHLIKITILTFFLQQQALAQIQFVEDTPNSGISHVGESWGASWGNLNNDAYPDLFVSNHREKPGLYVNNGDGTFTDERNTVPQWTFSNGGDQHGAAWADFDNDGDQDLLVTTGTSDGDQFLVNENGLLVDRSNDYNFDNVYRAGRSVVWLDFNNDSLLDLIYLQAGEGIPKVLEQTTSGFVENQNTGVQCQYSYFGQLTDLNNDGVMEFICATFKSPNRVAYDITTFPFTDITGILPNANPANDSITADFDGNLRSDFFHVRGAERISSAAKSGDTTLEAQLLVNGQSEKGFHFLTNGILSFTIHWQQRNRNNIFIGSTGWHPSGFSGDEPIHFSLDPSDPSVWGIQDHLPGLEKGIYIGYETTTGYWQILVSAGGKLNTAYFLIGSTTPVSDVNMTQQWGSDLPMQPALLMNYTDGFQNKTESYGLATPIECTSAAAGDFDNDMDIDLYLACRRGVENVANRLYENLGNGTFQLVAPNLSGAKGVEGTGVNSSESVVVADYNVDGFLDLFVTNGQNYIPGPPYTLGGPDQIFRNLGNQNNWIEIDLNGTSSNKSGIGAKVYATSGGITQLREQNGGYHRYSQNHQRIHYGLASNTLVDLRIEWPSGIVDNFVDVPVNRLYQATEAGGLTEVSLDVTPPSSCGKPIYDGAVDTAIFLWQNCETGQWSLRATSGSNSNAQYIGSLTSDQVFTNVTPFSLEVNDVLDTSNPTRINYEMSMWSPWDDGFDFSIPTGSNTCLDVDTPAGAMILVGPTRNPVSPPFNLDTLGPCTAPVSTLSINDALVTEGANTVSFTVTLSTPSNQTVTVDVVTTDGTATAPTDYTPLPPTVLTFNPGETSKTVIINIEDDNLPEGTETFTVNLNNAINSSISKANGTATINDNDLSVCGPPSYDGIIDGEIFLWKDCTTGQWSLRVTAGASGNAQYIGSLESDQAFNSVTPFSVESGDVLDISIPTRINFDLRMWSPWEDGFDFSFPTGAKACLDLSIPAGTTALVGPLRSPVNLPFDLESLSPCVIQ